MIFPLLCTVAVVVGAVHGMGYWGVIAIIGILPVHFLVLPKLAGTTIPGLERELIACTARKDVKGMVRTWNRAFMVRLYAPAWYIFSKGAWVASAQDNWIKAEKDYTRAAILSPKGHRTIQMANLASVKERLGKHKEAESLRSQAIKQSPGLAKVIEACAQKTDPDDSKSK